jgi:hypothetical protein
MISNVEKFLDVLQNIEAGLARIYGENDLMTDSVVMMALDKGKIAVKQQFGYAKSQNGTPSNQVEKLVIGIIVEIGLMRIGKINNLKLDDYISLIDKVNRSVDTHRQHGIRGYYDFIKNYV